jgi:AcrR family transcriptional regulator
MPQRYEKCGLTEGNIMKEIVKEDLRIRRTREAIHNAFREMLVKMAYNEITVKDLAKLANINRKTFYLHYISLDDLMEEVLEKISDEFIKRVAAFKGQDNWPKLIREFFLYRTESLLLERITSDESCHFLFKKVNKKILEKGAQLQYTNSETDNYKQSIITVFSTEASIGIFRKWVADGKKIPIEEIISYATQLLCNGIHGATNRPPYNPSKRK